MAGFSGGILRYAIVIDAIDRATGKLGTVNRALAGAMRPGMMGTFKSPGLKEYVNNLTQIKTLSEQMKTAPPLFKDLMQAESGKLKSFNQQFEQTYQDLNKFINMPGQKGMTWKRIFGGKSSMLPPELQKQLQQSFTGAGIKTNLPPAEMWKQMQLQMQQVFKGELLPQKEIDVYMKSIQRGFAKTFKVAPEILTKSLSETDVVLAKNFTQFQKIAQQQADMVAKQEQLRDKQQQINQSTQYWAGNLNRAKSQLTGIVTLLSFAGQEVQKVMQNTRELMEAQVLMGKPIEANAYNMTQYGATIDQIGRTYKSLARSPLKDQIKDISQLNAYMKIFNQQPEQLIPVISGFSQMGGGVRNATDALNTMFLAASKGFADFGGWYSMVMQGFVPSAQELNMSLNETTGLLAAMSQLGISPFGMAFGLQDVMGKIIAPTEKIQELWDKIGVDMQQITKSKGLIPAFEALGKAMSTMTEPQKSEVMTTLFGSFSKGIALAIMNNTGLIKNMQVEMGNTFEVSRQLLGYERMGYYQWGQMQAQVNSLFAQFINMVSESQPFIVFIKGIIISLQTITGWLNSLNKIPIVRDILGGVAVGALVGISIWMGKLIHDMWTAAMNVKNLANQLKNVNLQLQLMKLNSAGAPITLGLGGQGAGKLAEEGAGTVATAGIWAKILGVGGKALSVLGWIGLIAGVIFQVVNWVKAYFDTRHKAEMEKIVAKWANASAASMRYSMGGQTSFQQKIDVQSMVEWYKSTIKYGGEAVNIPKKKLQSGQNNLPPITMNITINGDYTKQNATDAANEIAFNVYKTLNMVQA